MHPGDMIELEPACAEDLPLFMAMEREPDAARFVLADSLDEHLRLLAAPDVLYLRIRHGGIVAGFIILVTEADETSVEFRRIVVSSHHRGIGQAAIEVLHAYCRNELGRSRIWLDVFADNSRARHVYARLGYRQTGHRHVHGSTLLCHERSL